MKQVAAGVTATAFNAAVATFDPGEVAAAACTYVALVTGLLTAVYIAYGIAIRITEWKMRRVQQKRMDNDLLREISDGYDRHHRTNRNDQHRDNGFGERDNSEY
jgi:hypothetical protein